MAQVVRLMDVRAAQRQSRQAHDKGLRMAPAKAPYTPQQVLWHGGFYFFAGAGFALMFATWMASAMTTGCFMAAGYCDQRTRITGR